MDRDFKYILQQSLDSKLLQFLKINNIKNLLESMLNLLATTKKSLNDFLEVNIFCIYLMFNFLIKVCYIVYRINVKVFQDFTF